MFRLAIPAVTATLFLASPAHAGDRGWSTASDIGRNGLVIVALGLPAVEGDWKGTKEAAFSIGATSQLAKPACSA